MTDQRRHPPCVCLPREAHTLWEGVLGRQKIFYTPIGAISLEVALPLVTRYYQGVRGPLLWIVCFVFICPITSVATV